jgi:MOSC domain-containing protein YiiM
MDKIDLRRDPALRELLRQRKQPGVLRFIGVRPARGATVVSLAEGQLLTERGLEGDIASARTAGKRQLSLLQAEHLPVIAALCGVPAVEPALLRRNLVVSGINLLALRSTRFRIGATLLEGTGTCDPCSKLERALGEGGYNAVRGHGGILARVLEGGPIRVGDLVDFAE